MSYSSGSGNTENQGYSASQGGSSANYSASQGGGKANYSVGNAYFGSKKTSLGSKGACKGTCKSVGVCTCS